LWRPKDIAEAIVGAGAYYLENFEPSQFCVDIYHGGGGTAAYMNVNEVLANRANEALTGRKGYDRVHPGREHGAINQRRHPVFSRSRFLPILCAIKR
jgi:aspartate ammonia-lyase